MPVSCVVALIVLATSGMTGCNPRHDNTGPDDDLPAASKAVAPAPTTADANVSARYACQGNTRVALMHAGGARVSLPDGRTVDLERVAGSTPAVFSGSSLYFTTGDHDAYLSQHDGSNELACKPD